MNETNENEPSIIVFNSDGIDYQQQVEPLYITGLQSYGSLGENVARIQESYLKQRFHPQTGDMVDIYRYYIDPSNEATKHRCFWVAVEDSSGDIVGTVAAMEYVSEEENDIRSTSKDAIIGCWCELGRMTVAENYRRCGLASRLVKTVEDWAKRQGFSQIKLSTLKLMTAANAFYQRVGFESEGIKTVSVGPTTGETDPLSIEVAYYSKSLS